ncbi:conserved hypothetical protein [Hyella patelloides LEGE 07179]|uniref:Protein-glutamine gamma-glutamyltransferase-like C-terminal domain-containing protein n=1 Tax=Hyella patelloides LEGE 07179 TaxID=945734 RepID=A0A563VJL9_9CYAN|nr:DUF4129 domain-containing protein [Hyella patelloides]VEP11505.1 conserved hypothetical protein [Hyella patelloides LEGE 07179]
MLATVFKQDSIRWKIALLLQRLQEWWEVFSSQLLDNAPDVPQLNLDAEWIEQLIKILLWSIIAAILIWLTWQFWLLIRPYWIKWQKPRRQLPNLLDAKTEATLSINEWIAQSQYYQKQRNYRQAIFCLYQAMIQELSDRNMISILSSRTDREYLALIKNLPLVDSDSYELLLTTHEKLCFTKQAASQSLWEQCQQAYQLISTRAK